MGHTVRQLHSTQSMNSSLHIDLVNGSLIGQNRTVILISGSIISFASEHLSKKV